MSPHPGEVWLADLGLVAKTRPVVIVSRHDPDAPRALTIYVPLTTQNRGSKYEVELPKLPFLREISVANVQGIASLTVNRLERRLGEVPSDVLRRIREALAFATGLAGGRSHQEQATPFSSQTGKANNRRARRQNRSFNRINGIAAYRGITGRFR
jgi:mRNA interferase MazF